MHATGSLDPSHSTFGAVNQPLHASLAPLLSNTRVAFLVNFVAPNLLEVFRELSTRVKQLTVISSVDLEGNRDWKPETTGLDYRRQKTWTWTRTHKHPGGYVEPNYIHFPLDTLGQLRRAKPDVVISLELGMRTLLSQVYRRLHRRVVHLAVVLASERTEQARGGLRTILRSNLLRSVDAVTYNGPSCRRYLLSMGIDCEKLCPWDYAADPRKPYRGPLTERWREPNHIRLLTVGQLSERKGVDRALWQLNRYAHQHPSFRLSWTLVGNGPLKSQLQATPCADNLTVTFAGHCEPAELQHHYCQHDAMLFPTLGDEWGLVVDESMMSGLPVIGSIYSQASETLIDDGLSGFTFDPEQDDALEKVFDRFVTLSDESYQQMRLAARASTEDRTPAKSADQMVNAILVSLSRRGLAPQTPCTGEGEGGS